MQNDKLFANLQTLPGTMKVTIETGPGQAAPVTLATVDGFMTQHGLVLASPSMNPKVQVVEARMMFGTPTLTVDDIRAQSQTAPGNIQVVSDNSVLLSAVKLSVRRMIELNEVYFEASPNESGWFETLVLYT